MLARGTRSPSLYAILAVALVTLFLYYRSSTPVAIPRLTRSGASHDAVFATNATLGFGGLFAVSGPGSPRRNRLEQAATVTGLELTIPTQPQWTDEDVDKFRWPNKTESLVLPGTVKAWLSHHVVLRTFLESGLETALIFEDDVDWDIRLRNTQVPLAQSAARSLSKSKAGRSFNAELYPWGPPSNWDLLYLGHCGDWLNSLDDGVGVGHHHPGDLAKLDHVLYKDPTMLNHTDLHKFTAGFLTALAIPEQTRVMHHSIWPLCTFGYAVTRSTAERLLKVLAPPKEDISKKLTAYDAAILTACRDGALYCLTLTPELFHHMEGDSMIATEEKDDRVVFRPPVDAVGLEQVQYRKETSNIGCGFWSGEFYYEGDDQKLKFVKEEVVAKGNCFKPGRDL